MKQSSTLRVLLTDIVSVTDEDDRVVTGLSIDSRALQAGDIFIACKGQQTDARHFIDAAVAQGVVAVLVEISEQTETAWTWLGVRQDIPIIPVPQLQQKIGIIAARFYQHPSQQLTMIGVTGTNGKTSCTHFIAKALQMANRRCAIIGTLGNGLSGHLQPSLHTTPDALALQHLLRDFSDDRVDTVAMEVSSHGLVQARVNGVQFSISVFTNLTRDHLDYHGDMQSYANAKRLLFDKERTQAAVINADDAFGRELLSTLPTDFPVVAYTQQSLSESLKNKSVVRAHDVVLTENGFSARVQTPWGQGVLHSRLLGRFNVSNLLAVLAVLGTLKIPLEEILHYLGTLSGVSGRMEVLGGEQQPTVVVDYAHTPDALEQALAALREHCKGYVWCVFGCGGDRDRGKRPLMGKIAEQYADHVILTDDNPRMESSQNIVADIIQGMSPNSSVVIDHDRARAIAHALNCARKGDIVLVAGKGHELYQQVGGEKRPFSDIVTIKRLLEMNQDEFKTV